MSIFSTSAFATEHKVSNVDLNSLIKISSSEFPDAYIISEFYDDNSYDISLSNSKVYFNLNNKKDFDGGKNNCYNGFFFI
jgi:hypothetical protein